MSFRTVNPAATLVSTDVVFHLADPPSEIPLELDLFLSIPLANISSVGSRNARAYHRDTVWEMVEPSHEFMRKDATMRSLCGSVDLPI
jgi:hypothetical protein